MNALKIRAGLLDKGHSYASVGRTLKPSVSRQAVRRTAERILTSTRIMQAIADIMGRNPADVFPEASHLFDSPENLPQNQVV